MSPSKPKCTRFLPQLFPKITTKRLTFLPNNNTANPINSLLSAISSVTSFSVTEMLRRTSCYPSTLWDGNKIKGSHFMSWATGFPIAHFCNRIKVQVPTLSLHMTVRPNYIRKKFVFGQCPAAGILAHNLFFYNEEYL